MVTSHLLQLNYVILSCISLDYSVQLLYDCISLLQRFLQLIYAVVTLVNESGILQLTLVTFDLDVGTLISPVQQCSFLGLKLVLLTALFVYLVFVRTSLSLLCFHTHLTLWLEYVLWTLLNYMLLKILV